MFRLIVLCLLFVTAVDVQAHLIVKDAWVREAPPRARTLAMFLQLTNHDDKTINIVSASSEQFEKVEIHKTSFKNGMMRMQRIESLEMSPNEVAVMKPGGLHIMLVKPARVFKAGDQINIKLHLASGKKKTVRALVRGKAPMTPMQNDHGHSH